MLRLTSSLEKLRPLQAMGVLCLLGAVVHIQSLFVGYLADDFDLLHAATSSSYDVLRDAFPAGRGTYFRPLVIASLRLEHALLPTPFLHHVVNLAAHIGTGVLVYALTLQLVRRATLAFVAASFFLIHPVTAYDVNWISGRTDVFAAFFALLSLHAFLRSAEPARARSWALLSVVALVLALSAKEVAVFTPVASAALLWFERSSSLRPVRERDRRLASTLALQLVVTFAWVSSLYFRFYRGGGGDPPRPGLVSLLKGLVAAPLGFVWPNAYWVLRHLMIAHPVATPVAGGIAVMGMAVAAIVLVRRSERPAVFVALGVFAAAPLLPLLAAGLTPATRLLHVPLATTSVALGVSFAFVSVPRLVRKAAPVLFILIAFVSIMRGRQWVDNSQRMARMCEEFKTLRSEAPGKDIGFLSTAFEIDEVPLFFFHQHAALGACLADHRSFEPMELLLTGPVVLDHSPSEPVISIERRSVSDFELRASSGALFAFDIPLDRATPVVFPELSLLGTDVRHGREVHGFVVSVAPQTLASTDLLFFDGISIRRVPPAPP